MSARAGPEVVDCESDLWFYLRCYFFFAPACFSILFPDLFRRSPLFP